MRKNFLSMLNLAKENQDIDTQDPTEVDTEAAVAADQATPGAVVDAVAGEPVAAEEPAVVDVNVDAPQGAEVSIGDAEAFEIPEVSPETEMAVADPIEADVQEDIIDTGEELVDAGDEVPYAEQAADYASNLADTVEGQIEQNEVGPDPVTTVVAAESLSVLLSRYEVQFKPSISRENFATKGGRLAANKELVRVAREAEATMRDRIKSVVDKIVAWLKNLFEQLTDKGARVAKKAEGLAARAKEAKLAGGETNVMARGEATAAYLNKVSATAKAMLDTASNPTAESSEGQSQVPGYSFVFGKQDDGKFSVEVQNNIEEKEIKSLNSGQIGQLCAAIAQAARAQSAAASRLKTLVASIQNSKDEDKSAAVSRVTTGQKLVAESNKLLFGTISDMFAVIEQSIAGGSKSKTALQDAKTARQAALAGKTA